MPEAPDIALMPEDLAAFYAAGFGYYATLAEQHKLMFTRRCLQFISEKDISGAGGFVPDNRVKALLAASAVQLTLGLETWNLNYFEAIVIYPGIFENATGELMYKGETNIAGFIKLSWKSFMQGYLNDDDNINLGLHEFSHALRFNAIRGARQDYFFEHYFNSWLASAYEAYHDIRAGRSTIFRKYGGANINEFISVCIEHYFESPEEIRMRYPSLYYSTAILLNQETGAGHTRIGIRQELLNKKNVLLPGFSQLQHKTMLRQSGFFRTTLFVVPLSIFFTYALGYISPPVCFFWAIWLFSYLRFDFKFTRIHLQDKRMKIGKGFFFFRGFRNKEVLVSSLVSFRGREISRSATEWKITFYNPADTYFYEETVHAPTADTEELIKELALNKIARSRQ